MNQRFKGAVLAAAFALVAHPSAQAAAVKLQTWQRAYVGRAQGVPPKQYSYTMVGTDPAKVSATTTVPIYVINVEVDFIDVKNNVTTILNAATDGIFPTGWTAEQYLANSPLIQNSNFNSGGMAVGMTQYADAFQRGNFWTDVQKRSPNYHVLLGAPQPIPLFMKYDAILNGVNKLIQENNGLMLGVVDEKPFNAALDMFLNQQPTIRPNGLAIFLTHDVAVDFGDGKLVLGFHSVLTGDKKGAGQTFVMAMVNEPGLLNDPDIADVAVLSHEIGEWLDDPFSENEMPGAGGIGYGAPGVNLLEVGDPPAVRTEFATPLNFKTFHLQNLAYHDFFACKAPSTSVGKWYSFLAAGTRAPNC